MPVRIHSSKSWCVDSSYTTWSVDLADLAHSCNLPVDPRRVYYRLYARERRRPVDKLSIWLHADPSRRYQRCFGAVDLRLRQVHLHCEDSVR